MNLVESMCVNGCVYTLSTQDREVKEPVRDFNEERERIERNLWTRIKFGPCQRSRCPELSKRVPEERIH